MPIRCPQCGAHNHPHNSLCLNCGAYLTQTRSAFAFSPSWVEPGSPPKTVTETPATESEPATEVSDSSSIAASEESNDLAEDVRGLFAVEPNRPTRRSHTAHYFLLVVLLGLSAAAAGWHWRGEIFSSRLTSQTQARPSASTIASPTSSATPNPASPVSQPAESSPSQNQAAMEKAPPVGQPSAEVPPTTPRLRSRRSKARIRPASAITRTPDSQETEGEKYLYGDGVPVDCDRAQKDLLTAARRSSHSSAKAEKTLGAMYATGHCVIRDLPLAYRWLARAQRQHRHPDPQLANDMKGLLNQMSPEERDLATR